MYLATMLDSTIENRWETHYSNAMKIRHALRDLGTLQSLETALLHHTGSDERTRE